jgi:hypothetical protein
MRCRQKQYIHTGVLHPLPGKTLERKSAVTRQLRIGFTQVLIRTVAIAAKEKRFPDAIVAGEQAHQFEAGITGRTENRGLYRLSHLYRLPKISTDAVGQPLGRVAVGSDHQNRVVAADGAHDLFPFFAIDRG